jgi:ABC-type protease/lipase transport system fused ATPase/permease subunit
MGYLPQDVKLFAGTVAENISRFKEGESTGVVAAAQLAGTHDMIQKLSNGYETQMGDGGHQLSGGQRQRVGLARALYGDPVLVILDEPNSNLDSEGEMALMEALRRLKERKVTVIIVTHKPSVLSLSDKVLLLKDGAVQSFGPANNFLNANPGIVPLRQPAAVARTA